MPKQKPAPSLPAEASTWTANEVGHYLINSIAENLGPAVYSELLPRQLESCVGGSQAMTRMIRDALTDPMARRYTQLLDERVEEASSLLVDHVRIFCVACQVYVTRVVETVLWLKLLAASRCEFLAAYKDASGVRAFGKPVHSGLTIAECVWHLGNYAKHFDELEELRPGTMQGLTRLGLIGPAAAASYDVPVSGVLAIAGKTYQSDRDLEDSLRVVVDLLREWAQRLQDELIEDLSQYQYGDRAKIRRDNDSLSKAVEASTSKRKTAS